MMHLSLLLPLLLELQLDWERDGDSCIGREWRTYHGLVVCSVLLAGFAAGDLQVVVVRTMMTEKVRTGGDAAGRAVAA